MSSRSKGPVLAAVVVLAAFTLSGCAGGGAQPGVAAEVGDETVSTSRVDDLTVAYCEGLEPQLEANGAVFPMSYVRGYVVRNLTVRAAAEQLAEDYGIDVPPGYEQSVRSLRDSLAAGFREDRVDDVVEVESVGPYVQGVQMEVGDQLLTSEGNSDASDEEKLARGQQAMVEWLAEHPAEVNPRYGIEVVDTSLDAPAFVDTSTSFPLSDNAVKGAQAEPDQEHAATLPSTQRCG
jgi:peptidyl-prolyl cis-trans isomerase SurA